MPSIHNSKCVLVTGATSDIGRALALAIATLPSRPVVIAAGRRKERLEALKKAGLETIEVNFDSDNAMLKKFADEVVEKYPDLDTVIYAAGAQHELDINNRIDIKKVTSEMNSSLFKFVTKCNGESTHINARNKADLRFLLPSHLALLAILALGFSITVQPKQPCSLTISLRVQLKDKIVHVIEIMPPLVESELHDTHGTSERLSKFWMPLDEYTKTTMEGLRKGDKHISCGISLEAYKRFEEGKDEFAANAATVRSKW